MTTAGLVFMLDVDNTLLDNDLAKHDMDRAIRDVVPAAAADRFWQLYEAMRDETGVVDFPRTLARFGQEYPGAAGAAAVEQVVMTFPYDRYLYPRVPDVLAHLWTLGTPVIVSDGDPVFQAHKIAVSGLVAALRGNVLIFDHKEQHLDDVEARFPAPRYVMVDDKDSILDAMKRACGAEVVTVHVCQGKYATAPDVPPPPDIEIDRIGELLRFSAGDFRPRIG